MQLQSLVDDYQNKVKSIRDDVTRHKTMVQELQNKKKQVENLRLQILLQKKLKEAEEDLDMLDNQLGNVHGKVKEFDRSRAVTERIIKDVQTRLMELRSSSPSSSAAANRK